MNCNNETFMQNLAYIQKKYRLNYSRLGEYLGLGPHMVSRYVSGKAVPPKYVKKLLEVMIILEKSSPEIHKKYLPECDFHYRKASKIVCNIK